MPPPLHRTRIVCIADTHNASPRDGCFKLPAGDILVHAGDLTKSGTLSELQKTLAWLAAADFEAKIVVAGNHDVTLDRPFYAAHGASFHNQAPQDPDACIQLLRSAPGITYLEHESIEVQLSRPGGPRTRCTVFGSPYSPAAHERPWAFQYEPSSSSSPTSASSASAAAGDATFNSTSSPASASASASVSADELWSAIPLATDLLITHTPPAYHLDTNDRGASRGCEALRRALWRVRPLLHVCGHVHTGRGAEIVRWDLETRNVRYKESGAEAWDVGGDARKPGRVDLSARGGRPLGNVSGEACGVIEAGALEGSPEPREDGEGAPASPGRETKARLRDALCFREGRAASPPEDPTPAKPGAVAESSPGVHGQGGVPLGPRSDVAALRGRLARRETCVVNAAVMATSWPYPKGPGARRFNQPIVVDIDLPVAGGESSGAAAG